ncbi:MAG: energy transducer TonB [Candidatus Krumholzibacteriaceae bacterium]|jgi:TonB family protein
MRLQYRIPIVVAAVIVIAATFYPAPMRANRAGKPDSSKVIDQRTASGSYYEFDTAPVLLKTPRPVYPEKARKLGVEATVLLEIAVDDSGKVMKARVIDPDNPEIFGEPAVQKIDSAQLEELRSEFGDSTIEAARMRPLFEKSAIDAAMQFSFKPATLKGKAVPSSVAVPIRFKLH